MCVTSLDSVRGGAGKVAKALRLALLAAALVVPGLATSWAADEPDLIFRKSTVFHLATPNDKLATYAIDDPLVDGVACHFTVPERGGLGGFLGVA